MKTGEKSVQKSTDIPEKQSIQDKVADKSNETN